MNTAQANLLQAQLMIEELIRLGLDYFVVCPGARSSPLVVVLSQEDRPNRIIHQDERGAAYHAVGYARATGRAAVVITTSGTAAANLFPAIVEASMDNLPLIAITADRPPELRRCGANQTIDQVRLYGDYPRFFVDLPCPDGVADPRATLGAIDTAYGCAHGHANVPGPVHINCMFREPLIPPPEEVTPLREVIPAECPKLSSWLVSGAPSASQARPRCEPSLVEIDTMARMINQSQRGLLLIGELRTEPERQAVLELSRRLAWPTLADITSGIAGREDRQIITHYDLVLASDNFRHKHAADTVIHIGDRMASKRLLQFIDVARPASYLSNSGQAIVFDPVHAVTLRTTFDNTSFCEMLGRELGTTARTHATLDSWIAASETAREKVTELCGSTDQLTEPSLVFALSRRLRNRAALFLASSMPIRDQNAYAALDESLPVASNRGASGIDGTIAAACGYAAGLDRTVTLLIGDQAALHDLNSLALVGAFQGPLVIVIANNNGGRIFELLPTADHAEALEPFFVAPHDMTFGKIAEAFGVAHAEVADHKAFDRAYAAARNANRPVIIEAVIDPAGSRRMRDRILSAVVTEPDQH